MGTWKIFGGGVSFPGFSDPLESVAPLRRYVRKRGFQTKGFTQRRKARKGDG
jgi:hypothetical protein